MSDKQILQFVFKAGFSTAQQVTSVSGRGVGMDVVRTNIEKIGGTVEIASQEGKGTNFTIKIPLTLAIVSALIVEAGGERFAIPQLSVVELVHARADSEHTIESVSGTPVLRLRDRLLPLVSLSQILELGTPGEPEAEESESFIVVAQLGNYNFGIIVDRVFDTEEIVVKPVSPILRDITMFSGNTILGDGSVVMILDPNGIAAVTGQSVVSDERLSDAADPAEQLGAEKVPMLIFGAGGGEPFTVPLSLVARLEEIERETVEFTGGKPVVQYRGALMPLVGADATFKMVEEGRQPIIVFTDGGRSMGLMVEQINDIVEDLLNIDMKSDKEGLLGTAVIAGRATNVIDVAHYLAQAFGSWSGAETTGDLSADDQRRRLLLVEDNPFFRNMLHPVLSAAGYKVVTAENADAALKLRAAGQKFDVIVSDIEMPGMDGFEFVEACRSDTRWQETPVLALSSHANPEHFERGREAGFTDYISKNNRDALLSALSETLSIAGDAA
jgi:two-component system chemotaxis sensor kinase CheA